MVLVHPELSLIDVMDRVLDKGIVIDYYARIHVLGIDVLTTVEARIVVASFETYLHHADAIRSASAIASQIVTHHSAASS
jgi:gas vesicle structural protein